MAMKPYEWWAERVEIDHMESETPGSRSFFGACPVHGGSDSLHVTEKNDKALVKCFGCSAKYAELVDAAESGEPEEPAGSGSVITVTRKKRTSVSQANDLSPLEWCADRCGMTLDELVQLGLPLSERGDRLIFEFEGRANKTRGMGEGKKKDITWEGAINPPLWPVPSAPDPEVTICEGEFDAIVLIRSGYDAYSITGGSSSPPDVAAFVALKALGVERVVVAFDEDEAGRSGRQKVTEAIRAADLVAIYGRPKGLEPLFDEKDARDIASRTHDVVELEDHPDTDLKVELLDSIIAAPPADLLLERLDPDDHTILFGDGGSGKGMIAAWWTSCLTRGWPLDEKKIVTTPMRVLILDYENHAETEWRPRVERFGGDMSRVVLVRPSAPIWDIAGNVAELIKELRVDFVVVDSAMYACAGADAYTPEGATKYSLAITQFRRPVLTLAHKTKSKEDQDKPFGSVFWHNGARLTISVEREGYDDPREIKTRKANHGADFHRAIDWSWVGLGLPARLDEIDLAKTQVDLHADIHADLLTSLGREPTQGECESAGEGNLTLASVKKAHRSKPITITKTSRAGTEEETDGSA